MTESNEKLILEALSRLSSDHAKLVDQFAAMSREHHITMQAMKSFMSNQEANNRYLQKVVEGQDLRIRSLEEHKATMLARLPERIVDGQEITKRLETVDDDLDDLREGQETLSNHIAWFTGVGAVIVFAVPFLITWLTK